MSGPAAPPAWLRAAAAVTRKLPFGRYWLADRLSRPGRRATPFLGRLPGSGEGLVFHCDLRDATAKEAFFTGRYAPQETLLLTSILQPGMRFVDVGANWGYFTLLAADRLGETGKILALEPDPRLVAVLRRNLAANRFGGIEVLEVAASDAPGSAELQGYDEEKGNFGVSRLVEGEVQGPIHFSVACQPLDDLLDERGPEAVDLLKMDIEGAEEQALRGLRRSLASGRVHRVMIELHPVELGMRGSGIPAVTALLEEAGYAGWVLDHSLEATRAVAYGRSPAGPLLHPLQSDTEPDRWPHMLWLAPGIEAPRI